MTTTTKLLSIWIQQHLNPNIDFDIVRFYPNHWDWDSLSRNPNITFEIVKEFEKWNWNNLSRNKFKIERISMRL